MSAVRPVLRKLYPRHVPSAAYVSHQGFLEKFASIEDNQKSRVDVVLRGRLSSKRSSGRSLFFCDTWSSGKKVQVVGYDAPPDVYEAFKELKKGDHLEIHGVPGRTETGELSIFASKMTTLSHCLHRIPEPFDNYGKRMMNRHLDYMVNDRSRRIIRHRSAIIRTLRSVLDGKGFLELETPILQSSASGASARPFETKSILGLDLQLRIAPELALKRAVVGGFDKVYEIGKSFRNEGLSRRHNPEFTTLEFYQAYCGIEELIELTKVLLMTVEETVFPTAEHRLFQRDSFQRLDFVRTIERAIGKPLPSDQGALLSLLETLGIAKPQDTSVANLYDILSTKYIEPLCVQPTFVTDIPAALAPLAKSTNGISHRFEMYVNKMELVNAYEEENDPHQQREKFMAQSNGALTPEEKDYCKVLEYGLPPTGGFGMGIDRLVMLLTGTDKINETLVSGGITQRPRE